MPERDPLVRVIRYRKDGTVHHSVVSEQPIEVCCAGGRMYVGMPFRYWMVDQCGRLEISATAQVVARGDEG